MEKLNIVALLVCVSGLLTQEIFAQKEGYIYNIDTPEVFNIWHRVADFFDRLRAVESAELSPNGRLAV